MKVVYNNESAIRDIIQVSNPKVDDKGFHTKSLRQLIELCKYKEIIMVKHDENFIIVYGGDFIEEVRVFLKINHNDKLLNETIRTSIIEVDCFSDIQDLISRYGG